MEQWSKTYDGLHIKIAPQFKQFLCWWFIWWPLSLMIPGNFSPRSTCWQGKYFRDIMWAILIKWVTRWDNYTKCYLHRWRNYRDLPHSTIFHSVDKRKYEQFWPHNSNGIVLKQTETHKNNHKLSDICGMPHIMWTSFNVCCFNFDV